MSKPTTKPTVVNVYEAKTQLSRLLELASKGETVIIAKAGKPIAQIGPLPKPDMKWGALKGQIVYEENDFLEPDPEVLAMFDDDLGIDVPR